MPESSAIFLLDDDPSVLRATGRLLLSVGWTVKTFDDPDAFLAAATSERPRLAVIDMAMPRMHGLEVQKRLAQDSPSTKVIVLTAKDEPEVRSKALAAGAVAFCLKLQRGDDLIESVRAALLQN